MIKNERQFAVTKAKLEKMETALKRSHEKKSDVDPKIRQAMLQGIKSQIEELKEELHEFEALKRRHSFIITSLDELPLALIKARVFRNLTQEELAEKLHVKPQQIQRYEQINYRSVKLERLIEIGHILGLKLEGRISASEKSSH